jgi:hypothetical protein
VFDHQVLEHTNMSDEYTTVSIREDTKADLADKKPDGMDWDSFLRERYDSLEPTNVVRVDELDELDVTSRLDDLETAIKHKIERETRR